MSKLQSRSDAYPLLSVPLRPLTAYSSLVILALLALQVAAPCLIYISCAQLPPTVSYAAALYGFDRWFVLCLVAVSLYLSLFFLSIYPTIWAMAGSWARIWLIFAIGSNAALWALAVFDEEQGAKFLRRKQVHEAVAVTYLTVVGYIVISGVECMWVKREMLKPKEAEWLWTLTRLVYIDLALAVFVSLQFKLAYSIHANWLWNEAVEAFSEWALLISAVCIPAIWSQAAPETVIEVQFHDINHKEGI